ncbi:MAG: bifunctional nuclease family protein [Mycobacterium leprae]
MIHLNLMSVGMVEETGTVIIVLRAPDLERLLVMEVGPLEGRAIALEAEGVRAPRPLTHDLMYDIIRSLGATVGEVQIRDFRDKVFLASLILEREGGERFELDARPSDAIAVAMRAGAPIYVAEHVMTEAGVDESEAEEMDEDPDDDDPGDDEGTILH